MSQLIGGCGGTQYGCCADGVTSKNPDGSNCPPIPTPVPAPKREFDQILSGDVKIKKVSNSDNYKITFSKKNISKMLLYQIWSPTSAALNNGRYVEEIKATKWVKIFFPNNVPVSAVPYAPTCVMELENDDLHVFVINDAKVNKNSQVVFQVSSKDIDPNNKNKVIKKLKKIPITKKCKMFHNVRFDIDAEVLKIGSTNNPPVFSYLNDKISDWTSLFKSITNISNTLYLNIIKLPSVGGTINIYICILPKNATIQEISYKVPPNSYEISWAPYVGNVLVPEIETSVNKDWTIPTIQDFDNLNLSGMTAYIHLNSTDTFVDACYFNIA